MCSPIHTTRSTHEDTRNSVSLERPLAGLAGGDTLRALGGTEKYLAVFCLDHLGGCLDGGHGLFAPGVGHHESQSKLGLEIHGVPAAGAGFDSSLLASKAFHLSCLQSYNALFIEAGFNGLSIERFNDGIDALHQRGPGC